VDRQAEVIISEGGVGSAVGKRRLEMMDITDEGSSQMVSNTHLLYVYLQHID